MAQVSAGLQKQFVKLGLTAGLNKKRDTHQLQNGELLTADNVVYSAVDGQVTKRFGYAPVTPQGAPFQGGPFKALGCRDDIEPIVLGQNTLNRYNVNQNLSTSLPIPTQGRLNCQPLVGSSGQTLFAWPPSHPHVAIDDQGKYACLVWEEPNSLGSLIYYGVQDQQTGAWIISPTVMPSFVTTQTDYYDVVCVAQPRVVYYNGYFNVLYLWQGSQDGTDNYRITLYMNQIALSNLAAGMTQNTSFRRDLYNGSLQLTTGSAACYDFAMGANGYVLAYPQFSTSNGTLVQAGIGGEVGTFSGNVFTPKQGLSKQQSGAAGVRVKCIANGPATTPFYISTELAIFACNMAGIVSAYTMQNNYQNTYYPASPTSCAYLSGSVYFTTYGIDNNNVGSMYLYKASAQFSTVAQVQVLPPVGSYLIEQLSDLFMLPSGRIAMWVGGGSNSNDNTYNSAFLLEVDTATATTRCIARTSYQSNYKLNYKDKTGVCEVFQPRGTQQFVTMLSVGSEVSSEPGASKWRAYGVLNRVTFDYAPARQVQVLPLPPGGNLIGGAYPLYYDGNEVVEAGFSAAPDYNAAQPGIASYASTVGQPTPGTSGGMAAATYSYICCFARRDAYGNVLRSAPSSAVSVTTTGSNGSVSFRPLYYAGGGNVVVEYYRNTPTLAGQGTYYFVGHIPVLSPKNSNYVPFTDTYADSSITAQRSFNQAETPCDPPPAVYHAALSDTRAYLIPADNRNQVWCSKLFTAGRTVEWNSSQYVTEGQNAGLFTGLAVLDANVIVFKADSICYFTGQGPDNSGANGTFTALQKLATDVGCIDAASIKVTPQGVVFRSRRGIELLTRSLQITYIGDNVEPLVQTLGPMSSVVLMPGYTELRFIPATAGQPVLVWDYGSDRWSTWGTGATGLSSWASVQAAQIMGMHWWISADGTSVNIETPNAYLDAGQPIVMTLETAEVPIGSAGMSGWGRLYRMALLGDFYTAHTLQVQFAYDHQQTYTDTITFDTTAGLVSGDQVYQFRSSRVPRQRMQSVRLRITDTAVVGQSCAISGIALEVADKSGLARLPGAKTL